MSYLLKFSLRFWLQPDDNEDPMTCCAPEGISHAVFYCVTFSSWDETCLVVVIAFCVFFFFKQKNQMIQGKAFRTKRLDRIEVDNQIQTPKTKTLCLAQK